ncbi:hypothetical protein E1B28_001411 [Marasmius oreades]|uniref:Uncharacterized protein n=1 Tax=Marasmius oreades TaxID=181124 RepID=A0A9P8AF53_9AGAR|nr:uncharacterized protein E1B28_001411 [Marasmius oreades]KAG7099581.1 hypothetical protein E1B28_001411 [Marasmius oreades]
MRVKQFWVYVPLPAKLKLVWERITFSRLTTAYFVFSVLHCFIQLGLQINAFTVNANAAVFLESIVKQAGATGKVVPALGNGDLRLCQTIAHDLSIDACEVVWSEQSGTAREADNIATTSLTSQPTSSPTDNVVVSVSNSATSVSSSSQTSNTVSPSSTRQTTQSATSQVIRTITIITTPTPTATNVNNAKKVEEDHDDDHEKDSQKHDDDDDGEEEGKEGNLEHRAAPFKRQPSGMPVKVTLNGGGFHNQVEELTMSCALSLNWPVSILDNTKREDVVFIAFQIWVLGMSIVAILNESIPHIVASLLTHLLATGWSGFQINHTASFRHDFTRFISQGACAEKYLSPNFWTQRVVVEYIILSFNIVALLISAYLTWKLVKLFGWQTFKRVGASLAVNRMYKLVLVMSIALQLSIFFMGVTCGLWIDDLFNGVAATQAWYVPLYKTTVFITIFLLIPWVILGWVSIRKELKVPMLIFLVLSLCYLAGWSVMFIADTFRWTFMTWKFFRLMAVASVFLTVVAFVLGVICRCNFGKGLPRYLNAQEPLPGDEFTPVYQTSDIEKVDFPSSDKPIPTFSAAFGRGAEVPPPNQMFPTRGSNGPRFFQRSAVPFESPRGSDGYITPPESVMTRDNSRSDTLSRSDSNEDYNYNHSGNQHFRSDSSDSGKTVGGRWVIE